MTIHGVTKEITFDVSGTFRGDTVQGKGADQLPVLHVQPDTAQAALPASAEDEIRLEIGFRMREAG